MLIGADADDIVERSNKIAHELVAPPSHDPGVCRRCCTWLPSLTDSSQDDQAPEDEECENCHEVRDMLGVPPVALSVASLYRKPSQLRDWLTRYKGRPDDEDPFDPGFPPIVRAMLGRFLIEHGAVLEERAQGIDAIAVVPSTDRPSPHPLEALIESLNPSVPLARPLRRGEGELGFRKPNRTGYAVAPDCPPGSILLVDDVYTTGARINSAAVALRSNGNTIAGALVLARRVNPEYTAQATLLWERATSTPYDWKVSPRV